MSKVKTKLALEEVKNFLLKEWSANTKNVRRIKGGEVSQAFSFEDEITEYIIKVRKVRKRHAKREPFLKEQYAYNYVHLQDKSIPIPKVIKLGVFPKFDNGKFIYCICEKHEGTFVHLISGKSKKKADLALIETLQRIHSIDISSTCKYGHWDSVTEAQSETWKEFILSQMTKNKLFRKQAIKSGKYDTDFISKALVKLKSLLEYCSEERYLVHADYGFDNVLANTEGKITAVFDWEHSLLGDFVYDIAWIDFWKFREEDTYANLYKETAKGNHPKDFTHYEERLLCYKLYIGVMACSFFIDSDQMKGFLSTKQIVNELLQM